jgi:hypothetical protein
MLRHRRQQRQLQANHPLTMLHYSNSTKDCDCTLSDFAAEDRKIRFYCLPFFCGIAVVNQYQTLVDNDEAHIAFDQQQYDSAVNGEGGLVTATQESLAAGKQTLENDEQTLATYKALEQQAENQGR